MKNSQKYLNLSKTKVNTSLYYQLNVADITIEVIKKNIKNLHISVNPPVGKVKIAAPKNASDDSIRLFAISKIPWIKTNQKKFLEQEREAEREYVEGETLLYQGKKYRLQIVENSSENRVLFKQKKYIQVHITSRSKVKNVFEEWLRTSLNDLILPKFEEWQKVTKLTPKTVKVRRMKTRWGSCNHDSKTIIINLELIKRPEKCIDYVILHELIHLKEPKHNEHFIKILTKYMPNWKQLRDELNKGMLPHTSWNH